MKFDLNTIILLLILIALVVGGIALFGAFQKLTHPLEEAEQAVQEQLDQIVNPTPTIIPDPMTIIHEVRGLSRLETASYTIEKVITAESGQGAFAFLFGDRLILVAHGQVIAGVDLSKMGEDDIIVTEDGAAVVTLPPAEVLVVTLDNTKSYVYDRDTGMIGVNPALETEARQAAEEEILSAALEDGILEMARQNAEVYVLRLILALGFREVKFADN
ncbi:MAG: DUF4230 domain-containing protein [Chloroflexi bacterium]|nr:MAG: hypothetical protein B6I35_02905 [Anaerolineaceae bacterium 4572_32.2]RLC74955.1 MAG: DUF4230 domain-containing protein [Chloroflexota bacterium]RLC86152.1 MAG: DUF4230 domain-containing protein [Chloroflexota bacterium]HEY72509.1 DUF4230 domain-containing protein [Thermoflexia bacterium]